MERNVILVFENKIYIRKFNNSINDNISNDKKKFTVKDLIKNTIDNISYKYFEKNINEYFIIKNGSPVLLSNVLSNLLPNVLPNELQNKVINEKDNVNYSNLYITCYRKMRGGADIIDMILMPIEMIFYPIYVPIKAIADVFISAMKLILWIALFIVWFVQFMVWVFSDLLNPTNFCYDFYNSVMMIVIAIFSMFFNIITGISALFVNTLGDWMQGFWGWDQSSLTKTDKESKYFKTFDKNKGAKYYLTNSNTVPFSMLLGTILCPPIGVFMDMGLSGWLNIIVCCLLTLIFYIPGLLYALLIIYS